MTSRLGEDRMFAQKSSSQNRVVEGIKLCGLAALMVLWPIIKVLWTVLAFIGAVVTEVFQTILETCGLHRLYMWFACKTSRDDFFWSGLTGLITCLVIIGLVRFFVS